MNEDSKELLARFEPKELKVLALDRQVHTVRFSPCGEFLFAGGHTGEIRRWRVAADEITPLDSLAGHSGWVQPIAFHPTEKWLFTADSWGQIRATSYAEELPATKWSVGDAHDGWVRDLSVSPDGKLLASCGRDAKVRLWSTVDGQRQHEFADHQHDVYAVRFHPAGASLVSGDERGRVKQWDLAEKKCVREFDAGVLYKLHRLQDVGGVRVLAFDKEGKSLAVGGTKPSGGGTVQGIPAVLLFDFESGELKHTLELGGANHVFVHDVHFHDAGFLMCVTSGLPGSGQLLFRRAEDKEPFFVSAKMANCQSLGVHPDGRRFAVVTTNRDSNGNGRRLTKDGEYPGNNSPIHVFEFPQPAPAQS